VLFCAFSRLTRNIAALLPRPCNAPAARLFIRVPSCLFVVKIFGFLRLRAARTFASFASWRLIYRCLSVVKMIGNAPQK
jgi:hypothetical protein